MEEKNIMYKIAKFIVDKRKAIYLIFAVALVLSAFSIPKVAVNNSITSYLAEDTETKLGLDIMDREFVTYVTTDVMVCNITAKEAEKIKDRIAGVEGVKEVAYTEDEDHYKDSAALYNVTLDENEDLDRELQIVDNIKAELSDQDCYFYSNTIDDMSKSLDNEMNMILLIAAIVILLVLLFTSQSYMEVPVYLIVFVAAAILNMGTNLWLGEISFITKAIAVVLQLALAIDYSIILSHRFAEEKATKDSYDAIVSALSKAIIEISSSSLTTISGLAALMIMQLRIGMDMGLVLCKGILFSLLAVFLLMPGLLLMFSKWIDKTRHRSFVPSIKGWCRAVVKMRFVVPVIFLVLICFCAYFSYQCDFSFDSTSAAPTRPTEKSIAQNKIEDRFGVKNTLAVVVPKGDHEKEKKILENVEKLPYISSATGLANTELKDGYTLTQKVTPREVAELMDMDYGLIKLVFQAYGIEHQQYNAILSDVSTYRVSILDLFMFLHEQMDYGVVTLDGEQEKAINELYDKLLDAQAQLEGEEYARMVFTYTCPVESDEAYQLLADVRSEAQKYYDVPILASNSTGSYDLQSSFQSDNNKISLLTVLAVMLILMLTFRSSSLPILLVLTIQGSIWINFSVPYLTSSKLFFLGYLVVSSIQMGATIDYAIVVTNRYLELRKEEGTKDAAIDALNQSFPTILTSGSILTVVGFLIGQISTNAMISSLGTVLGRGTLISIILVMLVLPEIIMLSDKLIQKTSFKVGDERKFAGKKKKQGTVVVDGNIQGYVCGYVHGNFHGIIRGDVDAKMDVGRAALEAADEKKREQIRRLDAQTGMNRLPCLTAEKEEDGKDE